MPLYGASDGFDITEKEPLRNSGIGTTSAETTKYQQYSIMKAIDSIRDSEVVRANLLLAPGIYNQMITNKIIRTADTRRDVLAIIDLDGDYIPRYEADTNPPSRGSVTTAVSNIKARNLNSSYACAFYPWVQITDNINGGQLVWCPPSVAGLGAMAKSQAQSDVWFAPAGFNRGGLGSLGGSRGPGVTRYRWLISIWGLLQDVLENKWYAWLHLRFRFGHTFFAGERPKRSHTPSQANGGRTRIRCSIGQERWPFSTQIHSCVCIHATYVL